MSVVTAQKLSAELRRDLELIEPYLDLERLLQEFEIEILYEKPEGRAEALSFTSGDRDYIIIDPASHWLRQRFTLAHELGHILLGHGATGCTKNDIFGSPNNPQEKEANAFSANLLLPARLFRQDIKKAEFSIAGLSELSEKYGTSLSSTAIRYTNLTNDLCAVVGRKVDGRWWLSKSDRVTWRVKLPPEAGTLAADRLAGRTNDESRATSSDMWLQDFSWQTDWLIQEEVVQTSEESWLVLLCDLPDADEEPDVIDREAMEELERRRRSFRRY